MAITKPPVLPAWADAGDKVQPSNAELSVGWPVSSTPPSRQRFNWVLNFVANAVRYFSRRGLVDYDAAETYMTGDRIIGDDGKTYRSLIDNNTAQTPSTSPTKWERWGFSLADLGSNSQTQATTAFTTAGAAPNFTLTPSPAITAYSANQRFRAKFHAAGTGADVINVNTLGNKSLKQYDATGSKVAAFIAANQLADIEYDGVDFVILDPLPPLLFNYLRKNVAINGDGRVRQGRSKEITASLQYGPDMWQARLSSGVPSAGTIQGVGFSLTPTKSAVAVSALTCTGAGVVDFVHRTEAADTTSLSGKQVTVSALVYHDVGANINWTIALRKATAVDNFTSVTGLVSSGAVSVPTGTATRISATYTMGASDGDNGLEALIQASVGAVTGKTPQVTELQIEGVPSATNSAPTTFEVLPIEVVRRMCERHYERSYPDGTAEGTVGFSGVVVGLTQSGGLNSAFIAHRYKTRKRVNPTLYIYDPSVALTNAIMADQGGTRSSVAVHNQDDLGFLIKNSSNALSANNFCYTHFVADARL